MSQEIVRQYALEEDVIFFYYILYYSMYSEFVQRLKASLSHQHFENLNNVVTEEAEQVFR